jgi:hypothetical protein
LRISRLDYVDRLTRGLLHFDLKLGVTAQGARGIGLGAQALNRSRNRRLVRQKCVSDGGVIVDVLGHHGYDLGKIRQRDKCRIESLRLCRVGERGAGEIGILLQPVVNIENFLWICAGRGDLREKGIGIEGDRCEQLVQFFGSGRGRVLRAEQRYEVLRK